MNGPTPSQLNLYRSLQSRLCPACGGSKIPRQTFCRADYRRLPGDLQHDLYRPLTNGYESAVESSLALLKVKKPFWPAVPAQGAQ